MASRPIIETRYEQMFPTLQAAEIDRLRHFGATRSYDAGELLVATGEVSPGMLVILTGLCAGQEVALAGAGNSAGQAAVYLATQVSKVWLLVRGRSLDASMRRPGTESSR